MVRVGVGIEQCMCWREITNDLYGVGSRFVCCAVNKLPVMEAYGLTFHLVNKCPFILLLFVFELQSLLKTSMGIQ